MTEHGQATLTALAQHLATRQEAILQAWHALADADPQLMKASRLTRAEFEDSLPVVLDAFVKVLLEIARTGEAEVEHVRCADEHGLQRWKHGYQLRELIREWGHLHVCLVRELEVYAQSRPGDLIAMGLAREALTRFAGSAFADSAERYHQVLQAEAEGRLRDLEAVNADLDQMERCRGELLHEAAHDLRGGLSAMIYTTDLLNRPDAPPRLQPELFAILQRSVAALREMMDGLLDLGRLEAGREQLRVAPFDAGRLLSDIGREFQPLAQARGLHLDCAGPEPFNTDGDALKVRRVALNLLTNALRYTRRGGVRLTWDGHDAERWRLEIADTGPGLPTAGEAPLAHELGMDAQVAKNDGCGGEGGVEIEPTPETTRLDGGRGEGIGLATVKRLCELLEADFELHSAAGRGTVARVLLPRRYGP